MDNLNPRRQKRLLSPTSQGVGVDMHADGTVQRFISPIPTHSQKTDMSSQDTLFPLFRKLSRENPEVFGRYTRYLNLGGPWTMKKFTRSSNYPHVDLSRNLGLRRITYTGPLTSTIDDGLLEGYILNGVPWPTDAQLEQTLFGLGGTAIKRSNPLKSNNQLILAILELYREGLPKLLTVNLLKNKSVRGSASEFLNYEFGWAPIISDIYSLTETLFKIDDLINQLHRNSDREVRRRYYFPDDMYTQFVQSTTNNFQYNIGRRELIDGNELGRLQIAKKVTTKTWFSGAFRYYIDDSQDLSGHVNRFRQQASHLLGLSITPELLWNLSPWTWLADWFANIGDVVSNISYIGQQGLVMRYGYIMQTTHVEAAVTGVNLGRPFGHGSPLIEEVSVFRKMRRSASPYGFGLNPTAFTPKQWAILAAVGLTQSPRSLL